MAAERQVITERRQLLNEERAVAREKREGEREAARLARERAREVKQAEREARQAEVQQLATLRGGVSGGGLSNFGGFGGGFGMMARVGGAFAAGAAATQVYRNWQNRLEREFTFKNDGRMAAIQQAEQQVEGEGFFNWGTRNTRAFLTTGSFHGEGSWRHERQRLRDEREGVLTRAQDRELGVQRNAGFREGSAMEREAGVIRERDPFRQRSMAAKSALTEWEDARQTEREKLWAGAQDETVGGAEQGRRRKAALAFESETERLRPKRTAVERAEQDRIRLEDTANMMRMREQERASAMRAADRPRSAAVREQAVEAATLAGPERGRILLDIQHNELLAQRKQITRAADSEEYRPGLAAFGVTDTAKESSADVVNAINEVLNELKSLKGKLGGQP